MASSTLRSTVGDSVSDLLRRVGVSPVRMANQGISTSAVESRVDNSSYYPQIHTAYRGDVGNNIGGMDGDVGSQARVMIQSPDRSDVLSATAQDGLSIEIKPRNCHSSISQEAKEEESGCTEGYVRTPNASSRALAPRASSPTCIQPGAKPRDFAALLPAVSPLRAGRSKTLAERNSLERVMLRGTVAGAPSLPDRAEDEQARYMGRRSASFHARIAAACPNGAVSTVSASVPFAQSQTHNFYPNTVNASWCSGNSPTGASAQLLIRPVDHHDPRHQRQITARPLKGFSREDSAPRFPRQPEDEEEMSRHWIAPQLRERDFALLRVKLKAMEMLIEQSEGRRRLMDRYYNELLMGTSGDDDQSLGAPSPHCSGPLIDYFFGRLKIENRELNSTIGPLLRERAHLRISALLAEEREQRQGLALAEAQSRAVVKERANERHQFRIEEYYLRERSRAVDAACERAAQREGQLRDQLCELRAQHFETTAKLQAAQREMQMNYNTMAVAQQRLLEEKARRLMLEKQLSNYELLESYREGLDDFILQRPSASRADSLFWAQPSAGRDAWRADPSSVQSMAPGPRLLVMQRRYVADMSQLAIAAQGAYAATVAEATMAYVHQVQEELALSRAHTEQLKAKLADVSSRNEDLEQAMQELTDLVAEGDKEKEDLQAPYKKRIQELSQQVDRLHTRLYGTPAPNSFDCEDAQEQEDTIPLLKAKCDDLAQQRDMIEAEHNYLRTSLFRALCYSTELMMTLRACHVVTRQLNLSITRQGEIITALIADLNERDEALDALESTLMESQDLDPELPKQQADKRGGVGGTPRLMRHLRAAHHSLLVSGDTVLFSQTGRALSLAEIMSDIDHYFSAGSASLEPRERPEWPPIKSFATGLQERDIMSSTLYPVELLHEIRHAVVSLAQTQCQQEKDVAAMAEPTGVADPPGFLYRIGLDSRQALPAITCPKLGVKDVLFELSQIVDAIDPPPKRKDKDAPSYSKSPIVPTNSLSLVIEHHLTPVDTALYIAHHRRALAVIFDSRRIIEAVLLTMAEREKERQKLVTGRIAAARSCHPQDPMGVVGGGRRAPVVDETDEVIHIRETLLNVQKRLTILYNTVLTGLLKGECREGGGPGDLQRWCGGITQEGLRVPPFSSSFYELTAGGTHKKTPITPSKAFRSLPDKAKRQIITTMECNDFIHQYEKIHDQRGFDAKVDASYKIRVLPNDAEYCEMNRTANFIENVKTGQFRKVDSSVNTFSTKGSAPRPTTSKRYEYDIESIGPSSPVAPMSDPASSTTSLPAPRESAPLPSQGPSRLPFALNKTPKGGAGSFNLQFSSPGE